MSGSGGYGGFDVVEVDTDVVVIRVIDFEFWPTLNSTARRGEVEGQWVKRPRYWPERAKTRPKLFESGFWAYEQRLYIAF